MAASPVEDSISIPATLTLPAAAATCASGDTWHRIWSSTASAAPEPNTRVRRSWALSKHPSRKVAHSEASCCVPPGYLLWWRKSLTNSPSKGTVSKHVLAGSALAKRLRSEISADFHFRSASPYSDNQGDPGGRSVRARSSWRAV